MDAADWSAKLDLFFGAASESLCRVYARLDTSGNDVPGDGWHLSGTLTGPECAYAATLDATFAFVDAGPGPAPLAEAQVPDPCFWTPAMPHLYRARIELHRAGRDVAVVERSFGIRPLATAGRGLRYGAKAWVLRGVQRAALLAADLNEWHAAELAVLVPNPDEATCAEASRRGVLLVAELASPDVREIRRLARWPAVGAIILPGDQGPQLASVGRNVLLGQRFASDESVAPAEWADVALCEIGSLGELPPEAAGCGIPILAVRSTSGLENAATGRAECDRLQRDLAAQGQFAGYIV